MNNIKNCLAVDQWYPLQTRGEESSDSKAELHLLLSLNYVAPNRVRIYIPFQESNFLIIVM